MLAVFCQLAGAGAGGVGGELGHNLVEGILKFLISIFNYSGIMAFTTFCQAHGFKTVKCNMVYIR